MLLEPYELYSALGEVLRLIESCPASTETTTASCFASDVRRAVGNRWNPPSAYAAEHVREAIADSDDLAPPQVCPHAAPFKYCPECVVTPCPIGLDRRPPAEPPLDEQEQIARLLDPPWVTPPAAEVCEWMWIDGPDGEYGPEGEWNCSHGEPHWTDTTFPKQTPPRHPKFCPDCGRPVRVVPPAAEVCGNCIMFSGGFCGYHRVGYSADMPSCEQYKPVRIKPLAGEE